MTKTKVTAAERSNAARALANSRSPEQRKGPARKCSCELPGCAICRHRLRVAAWRKAKAR